MADQGTSAPEGFTKGADTYDEAVLHNVAVSERLIAALPYCDSRTMLDVRGGRVGVVIPQERDLDERPRDDP